MGFETRNDETAFLPASDLNPAGIPVGVGRRTFMMRSAVLGAAAVITGCSAPEKKEEAAAAPPAPKPAGQIFNNQAARTGGRFQAAQQARLQIVQPLQ